MMDNKIDRFVVSVFAVVGLLTLAFFLGFNLVLYSQFDSDVSELNFESLFIQTFLHVRFDTEYSQKIGGTELTEELAENISEKHNCGGLETMSKTNCVINGFEQYVYNEIEYKKNDDIPFPDTVIERGYADCQGQTVLFQSLVKSYDFEYPVDMYFIRQPNHVCSFYRIDNVDTNITNALRNEGFVGCLDKEIQFKTGIY